MAALRAAHRRTHPVRGPVRLLDEEFFEGLGGEDGGQRAVEVFGQSTSTSPTIATATMLSIGAASVAETSPTISARSMRAREGVCELMGFARLTYRFDPVY